jgi:hypothetical protein
MESSRKFAYSFVFFQFRERYVFTYPLLFSAAMVCADRMDALTLMFGTDVDR